MNKKHLLKFNLLVLIFILSLLMTSKVFATSVSLNLNGKSIPIPKDMGVPFNKEGRVLVPLRFITENLGFEVGWDRESKEALIKNNDLLVTIPTKGDNPKVNGKEHILDVKPMVKNKVTYIPIRFISELVGKNVNYSSNAGKQTIFISDNEIYISPQPFSFKKESVNLGSKKVNPNVLTIDSKDKRVRMEMALANDKLNTVEDFQAMIKRKKPIAAFNGYFFDSYSGKNTTNGYIKNDFKTLNYEALPAAFFMDNDGILYIERPHTFAKGEDNIKHLVSVLPHLVEDYKDLAKAGGDMNHGKGLQKAQRTAIGITKDQKIKVVTVGGVTNAELANLMIKLGCQHAGNLDGGASSALYYNNKMITKPGRKLNNVVLFYLD